MTRETGRVVRRIAYLIEAGCMLGLISIRRQGAEPGQFAGIDLTRWLTGGLALGLSLWAVGTATLYWPRRKPDERNF